MGIHFELNNDFNTEREPKLMPILNHIFSECDVQINVANERLDFRDLDEHLVRELLSNSTSYGFPAFTQCDIDIGLEYKGEVVATMKMSDLIEKAHKEASCIIEEERPVMTNEDKEYIICCFSRIEETARKIKDHLRSQ